MYISMVGLAQAPYFEASLRYLPLSPLPCSNKADHRKKRVRKGGRLWNVVENDLATRNFAQMMDEVRKENCGVALDTTSWRL